jgi:predicted GIY-YIG superfamily endonuclease
MSTLYVLRLEGGNYYVGTTDSFDKRMEEHRRRNAALWTRKHKPVAVELRRPCTSSGDEEWVTKQYMFKYGIDHVRGSAYVLEILPKEQIIALRKELYNETPNVCTAKSKQYPCRFCDAVCESRDRRQRHETGCEYTSFLETCRYCGRCGHYPKDCLTRGFHEMEAEFERLY